MQYVVYRMLFNIVMWIKVGVLAIAESDQDP